MLTLYVCLQISELSGDKEALENDKRLLEDRVTSLDTELLSLKSELATTIETMEKQKVGLRMLFPCIIHVYLFPDSLISSSEMSRLMRKPTMCF